MTTKDLEQQARELLAAEYERAEYKLEAARIRANNLDDDARIGIRVIIAALTSAKGNAEGERVGPCFPDAEALATWLESLHECNDDGAVTGDKWEPAQKAAAAIRTQTLPVNIHGTWIEVPIRVQLYIVNLLEKLKASPATTEVEGEAVAVVDASGYPSWLASWLRSPTWEQLPVGTKLYTAPPAAASPSAAHGIRRRTGSRSACSVATTGVRCTRSR